MPEARIYDIKPHNSCGLARIMVGSSFLWNLAYCVTFLALREYAPTLTLMRPFEGQIRAPHRAIVHNAHARIGNSSTVLQSIL
jgi:hypothetical protein